MSAIQMTSLEIATATIGIETAPFSIAMIQNMSGGAQTSKKSTSSLSLLNQFYRISQPLRYFIGGNVGNLILFAMERILHTGITRLDLPESSAVAAWSDTISFFAAYMLHIPAQHYVFALLVYGLDSINTRAKYWTTLGGMYSALMTASVGSTVLNTALLRWGVLNRTAAFFTTMLTFACFNYFVIGWIVRKSNQKAAAMAKRKRFSPRGGGDNMVVPVKGASLCVDDGTVSGLSSGEATEMMLLSLLSSLSSYSRYSEHLKSI